MFRVDRELLDFKKIGIHLNQLMGSSSSIGAKRVRNVCVAFRAISQQNNRPGLFPLCALENTPIITSTRIMRILCVSLHFSDYERWCVPQQFTFIFGNYVVRKTNTWHSMLHQVFKSIRNFGTRVLLPKEQIA